MYMYAHVYVHVPASKANEIRAALNGNDNDSVDHSLHPQRHHERPQVRERVGYRVSSVGRYHPLQRTIETGVEQRARHGVAGEGESQEVGNDVAALTVETVEVDDDRVNNEQ